MVIDLKRCIGCYGCQLSCKAEHGTPPGVFFARVIKREFGTFPNTQLVFLPTLCFHCTNAPCVDVCPTGASHYREGGVVDITREECVGCLACTQACPYGARYFNYVEPPEPKHPFHKPTPQFPVPQQKGTVGKCMFCVHRTDDGKLPACLEACGMEAIYIGDLVEDVATNGNETVRLSRFLKDNDAYRYKEDLGTGPRVYYIAGHGQDLDN